MKVADKCQYVVVPSKLAPPFLSPFHPYVPLGGGWRLRRYGDTILHCVFLMLDLLHSRQETSEVVERERLRPPSGHVPSGFMRREFQIAKGQEANVARTKDQLPKLAKLAELFALNISPDGKKLIGIGMGRSLDTAHGLLDMHYKRLPQMAELAMRESSLKSKLKQTEDQKIHTSSVQFHVSPEHMPMLIGMKGNNIKKAQALPGIHVIEIRNDNSIHIFADQREQVYMYVCIHICVCACIYIYTYIFIYIHVSICV